MGCVHRHAVCNIDDIERTRIEEGESMDGPFLHGCEQARVKAILSVRGHLCWSNTALSCACCARRLS